MLRMVERLVSVLQERPIKMVRPYRGIEVELHQDRHVLLDPAVGIGIELGKASVAGAEVDSCDAGYSG